MRDTTAPELVLLHTPYRSDGCKVEIVRKSNAAVVDITALVQSGSITFSSDNRVAKCDISIEDVYPVCNPDSISPYISGSSYNTPGALLWPNNELKVYFGVNDLGSTVTDLKLAFHGVLGDSIGPGSKPGKKTVSMTVCDQAKRLQDCFIKGEYIYGTDGGSPVVSVIQGILNDNFTWTKSSDEYKKLHIKPTLDGNLNIDGCLFVVYPVKVGNCSVWDAINKVIACTASDDIGYELRYSFLPDGDTSTSDCEGSTITVSGDGFYLTLLEIDQSKTVDDDSIDAAVDEVSEYRINIFDDTIRNDIWGVFYDRNTKERIEVNRQDSSSIASYGKRTMVIGQDDVPFIDTYAEMWNLLGVAINALKDVPATDAFATQLMYHLDPNDLLGTTFARLTTGSASVGLTSITHNFAPGAGAGGRKKFFTSYTGTRDRVTGNTKYNPGGGDDPTSIVAPPIQAAGSESSFYQDSDSSYTRTILHVERLPEIQVEHYEWKYSINGSGEWIYHTTNDPWLRIENQPPETGIVWSCRAKLKGGLR